jgi:hypothetical protein
VRRHVLLPITFATVLLTIWALNICGWFHGHRAPALVRPAGKAGQNLTNRQAVLRYLQCQPRHWRYLMLQR